MSGVSAEAAVTSSGRPSPLELYGAGLEAALSTLGPSRFHVQIEDGQLLPLPVERWLSEVSVEERRILAGLPGPVIDLGCGPGRHLRALDRLGKPALGIDIAPRAVRIARSRGVEVLERDVFDELPDEGRWGSALLLDGNIGIGGDPAALLRRIEALLRPDGVLLLELGPPGSQGGPTRARVRSLYAASAWFPWALIGVDDLSDLVSASRFETTEPWRCSDGRWFVQLVRGGGELVAEAA